VFTGYHGGCGPDNKMTTVFTGYHGGCDPDNKMTKIKNTNIHTMIDSTLHRKLKIEQHKSGVNSVRIYSSCSASGTRHFA
jgi:hypothetical protein